MNIWVLIGFIVLVFFLWIWISDYRNRVKIKVVEDTEKEYSFSNKINEAKNILKKKKYFSNFNSIESHNNIYMPADMTIGHCPRCKCGYLAIAKTFTGMDSVYHRYPTYHKYLKCGECGYTENYINLKRRRSATKLSVSAQFKKDFEDAYTII